MLITGRSVKKDESLFNSQVRLQTRIEPGKLENYDNKNQECNEDVFQSEFHSELGFWSIDHLTLWNWRDTWNLSKKSKAKTLAEVCKIHELVKGVKQQLGKIIHQKRFSFQEHSKLLNKTKDCTKNYQTLVTKLPQTDFPINATMSLCKMRDRFVLESIIFLSITWWI